MPRGSGNPNRKQPIIGPEAVALSREMEEKKRVLILRHGLEEIISLAGGCPMDAWIGPESVRRMVEVAMRTLSHAFDDKGA